MNRRKKATAVKAAAIFKQNCAILILDPFIPIAKQKMKRKRRKKVNLVFFVRNIYWFPKLLVHRYPLAALTGLHVPHKFCDVFLKKKGLSFSLPVKRNYDLLDSKLPDI